MTPNDEKTLLPNDFYVTSNPAGCPTKRSLPLLPVYISFTAHSCCANEVVWDAIVSAIIKDAGMPVMVVGP